MPKLSLEGINSLCHQILKDGKTNIHNIELYQEDFEGIVMLTIEEAKIIEKVLYDFNSRLTEQEYRTYVQLGYRVQDAEDQIKKAEKGNG